MRENNNTLQKNVKEFQNAEEKYYDDMEELSVIYHDHLLETYYRNNKENIDDMLREIHKLFLYEKLPSYQRNKNTEDGIIYGIKTTLERCAKHYKNYQSCYEDLDSIITKVKLYFEKFAYPEWNDERDELLQEIIALENNNEYKRRLNYALLYSLYENLSEAERQQNVNEALADYKLNYKIPKEKEHYEYEQYRQKNYIPDFSDVSVGQIWEGNHRMAKFIRALKLTPKPAGKHSREAQEKSIARSCEWEDNKEKQQLRLTKIFAERKDRIIAREHKYTKYIETILIYILQKNNIYKMTSANFFASIEAVSKRYRKISLAEYEDIFSKLKITPKEIGCNLKLFREITYSRFKQIIKPCLEYFKNNRIFGVKTDLYIVVSGGKEHISVDEVDKIGLKTGEALEMIENASEYALSQIEIFDKKTSTKRPLTNTAEMLHHYKREEYQQIYQKYLKDNYGWEYTYESITLFIPDGCQYEAVTFEQANEARTLLNKLLVSALKRTIQKKDENLLKKYNHEENKLQEIIDNNVDVKELYELGVLEGSEGLVNTQYVYPPHFLQCVDTFLENEIAIPPL